MKTLFAALLMGIALSERADGQTNADVSTVQTVETLVCLRHGEKPKGGLGQLNCRGLNRALALPQVLLGKFGAPQFIFAPNPTQKVDGKNGYYYVRPLMTIEPTAVRCGLPVNTEFGFKEIKGLENELEKPEYQNAIIFVAWEHLLLDDFVKNLLKDNGGDPAQVPPWPEKEYDEIFVIKITRNAGGRSVAFTVDHEGLNNLSGNCP
jgi:hypothetical protein